MTREVIFYFTNFYHIQTKLVPKFHFWGDSNWLSPVWNTCSTRAYTMPNRRKSLKQNPQMQHTLHELDFFSLLLKHNFINIKEWWVSILYQRIKWHHAARHAHHQVTKPLFLFGMLLMIPIDHSTLKKKLWPIQRNVAL